MKSMEKLKKISIATAAICGLIIALSPHKTIPITNKKLQAISSLENIIDTNKTISINSIKLDSSDNFKELIKYNLWIDSTLNESKANNSNSIIVNKERRKLYLVKNGKIDSEYNVDLGFNPYADKQAEGDGCTPEGMYIVEKKLPPGSTNFYKAFLINYPNKEDKAKGKTGGLIEIHGYGGKGYDWTLGCISPSNEDMDKIFPYIEKGDRITIIKRTTKELSKQ